MAEIDHRPDIRISPLEVRQLGNAVALVLPDDLLNRLDIKAGDQLHLVEDGSGSLRLLRFDPQLGDVLQLADGVMNAYAETLAALAK